MIHDHDQLNHDYDYGGGGILLETWGKLVY